MSQPRHSGPRPLSLHLSLSLASWTNSPAGLMLSASGLLPGQTPELQNLAKKLLQQSPSQLAPALAAAISKKLASLLHGIERYQQHPYQRDLTEPDTVWQQGSSRLLDYGGKGRPVVFVPSLINRAYILDLDRKRSLLRWLAKQGVHPLLLDWGTPGATEQHFTFTDYIARLTGLLKGFREPVHLVGYCMGGNIALATALRHKVRSLTLLATPWDFHAGNKAAALRSAALYKMWEPACQPLGQLPVDLIQTLFTLLDPLYPQNKFIRFGEMTDSDDVESFVALEDWLNDGVPLPLPVARECLEGWYGANSTATGTWLADPRAVNTPTLVIIPEQDRIVPPASAEALANALPVCMRRRVPLGHIGMIVSRTAPELVWQPLAEWLKA